jgi:hypothetical protein
MRLRSIVATLVLALAAAAPSHAGDRPDPFAQVDALLASGALFRGLIREDDVSLLFAHLREALLAAQAGRQPLLPDELNRRAEAVAGELKVRGTLAGLILLDAFEAAARQTVRDAFPDPTPGSVPDSVPSGR